MSNYMMQHCHEQRIKLMKHLSEKQNYGTLGNV